MDDEEYHSSTKNNGFKNENNGYLYINNISTCQPENSNKIVEQLEESLFSAFVGSPKSYASNLARIAAGLREKTQFYPKSENRTTAPFKESEKAFEIFNLLIEADIFQEFAKQFMKWIREVLHGYEISSSILVRI
uniref:Uncharacterized protein n=1 Tax=Acrobeloides nanus TaxID=290746 RepID=A0A914DPV9_9BILA